MEIPEGWVARTPSLPWAWDLNHVGVTRGIDYEEAMELLERYQSHLPYRHLVIEHEPSGERLEDQLVGKGWKLDRTVGMALHREPDRELDTGAVIEADEAAALELMRQWTGEEAEFQTSTEAHRQVLETIRRIWEVRNARRFGVLGRDGSLAGITLLFSDGVVAQVEDVYMVPDERGRGFGRILVTHATALAAAEGHEFVFILADDQGWPKHLYASVGFEPVERTWEFHR